MSDHEYESDDTFVVVERTEAGETSAPFDDVIDPPTEENPAGDREERELPSMTLQPDQWGSDAFLKLSSISPPYLKRRRTDGPSPHIPTSEIDFLHSRISYVYGRLQEIEKKVTQDGRSDSLSHKLETLKADFYSFSHVWLAQYAGKDDVKESIQGLHKKMTEMKMELEEKSSVESDKLRHMNETLQVDLQAERGYNRDLAMKIDDLNLKMTEFDKDMVYLESQIGTFPGWSEKRIHDPRLLTMNSMADLGRKVAELEKKLMEEETQVRLGNLEVDFDTFQQISDARLQLYRKHVAESFQIERARNEKIMADLQDTARREIQTLQKTVEVLSSIVQEEKRRGNSLSRLLSQLEVARLGLHEKISEIQERMGKIEDWPEKVNLMTCTTTAALEIVAELTSKSKEFEKNAWQPKLDEINRKLQASINEHEDTDGLHAIVEKHLEKVMLPNIVSDNHQKMGETQEDNILERVGILENSVAELRQPLPHVHLESLSTRLDALTDQVEAHSERLDGLYDYQIETIRACKPLIAKTQELANHTAELEEVATQRLDELRAEEENQRKALEQLRGEVSSGWTSFTKDVRDSLTETQNYTQAWIGQIHKEMDLYKGHLKHYFNIAEKGEREFERAALHGERKLMAVLEDKIEGPRKKMHKRPRTYTEEEHEDLSSSRSRFIPPL